MEEKKSLENDNERQKKNYFYLFLFVFDTKTKKVLTSMSQMSPNKMIL
jgi:hypothetical protein